MKKYLVILVLCHIESVCVVEALDERDARIKARAIFKLILEDCDMVVYLLDDLGHGWAFGT